MNRLSDRGSIPLSSTLKTAYLRNVINLKAEDIYSEMD